MEHLGLTGGLIFCPSQPLHAYGNNFLLRKAQDWSHPSLSCWCEAGIDEQGCRHNRVTMHHPTQRQRESKGFVDTALPQPLLYPLRFLLVSPFISQVCFICMFFLSSSGFRSRENWQTQLPMMSRKNKMIKKVEYSVINKSLKNSFRNCQNEENLK